RPTSSAWRSDTLRSIARQLACSSGSKGEVPDGDRALHGLGGSARRGGCGRQLRAQQGHGRRRPPVERTRSLRVSAPLGRRTRRRLPPVPEARAPRPVGILELARRASRLTPSGGDVVIRKLSNGKYRLYSRKLNPG